MWQCKGKYNEIDICSFFLQMGLDIGPLCGGLGEM